MTRRLWTRSSLLALTLAFFLPLGVLHAQQSLEVGQTRAGSLATGDTLEFTFQAGEDFLLYGEVNQISVDVVVTLLNTEGQQVGNWDGPARGAEAFTSRIPSAGEYTLRVTPFEEEEGDFEIRIDLLEARADDPARLADQLMFAYDRPGGPGGAVRVWQDGETLFSKVYGLADLTHGIPFTERTPTNIGSTSKQFTAFAILLEEERGNLSLDDDVRDYFPEIPDFGETVTVRNLLTHTTGYREFLNLWGVAGMDTRSLTRDDVLRAVERQPALQNAPGAEFNYNNTAFSLAAQIVEKTSGMDFDDYMRENVFEPLGMNDSYVRMTPESIIPGRSDGYTPGSEGWTAPGDLGGAVGAGGIYASVADLERWGLNLLAEDPTVGTREMMEAMMTEFMLTDGEGSGYGLGLFIDEQRGLKRVHHGGADVSHRSMIVHYPEIDAGLTVQSNASTFNSGGTAFQLAAAWFGDAMEPEEPAAEAPDGGEFDPESYDLDDFERVAGSYTLDPQPAIVARFWRDGETLYTQLTGQQPVEIVPSGPGQFDILVVDATIVFEDGEPAPGFTLFQSGQEVHATRTEESAEEAEKWEPTPEELEDFVGRYFSEEIETFYTISLEAPEDDPEGERRLVMNQLRVGDMALTPGDRDTFTGGGGITLEFERDRNGKVVAAYVDATRSRDIRFTRVLGEVSR